MTTIENLTNTTAKLTCDCKTHAADANGAIVPATTAAAIAKLKGEALADRIHGFVTIANHPAKAIRVMNERKGIFAA